MSKFTDYIDGFTDETSTLAKDELKELIISAKRDESEFVRLQAKQIVNLKKVWFIRNKVEKQLRTSISRKAAKRAKRNNDRNLDKTTGFG